MIQTAVAMAAPKASAKGALLVVGTRATRLVAAATELVVAEAEASEAAIRDAFCAASYTPAARVQTTTQLQIR